MVEAGGVERKIAAASRADLEPRMPTKHIRENQVHERDRGFGGIAQAEVLAQLILIPSRYG